MGSRPHKRVPAHGDRRSPTNCRGAGWESAAQRGSRPTWETRPSRRRAASSLGLLRPPAAEAGGGARRPLGGACRGRGENLQPRRQKRGPWTGRSHLPPQRGGMWGEWGRLGGIVGVQKLRAAQQGRRPRPPRTADSQSPVWGVCYRTTSAKLQHGPAEGPAQLAWHGQREAGHDQNQARQTGPGSVAARTTAWGLSRAWRARARLTPTLSLCQAQRGQTLPLSVHGLMGEGRAPGCPAGLQPAHVLRGLQGRPRTSLHEWQ